ncbi:hypothetical protein [Stackebrandtia nassauensis]|uniref:Protein TolA n=1 Tax=Stackebrandtia nassauensis (strain DSM 44728 / CIP 108903 / NRRL B-16338 / NBRC 102104 / LLR-40K-21) TaxID=446470 RepID=D3PV05_STANL|nr:hypothetical protein [Stackebrandtia nassauensis]ADD45029.1 protein TolA [Stackebrandtia nassauensis DSM 44728]
MGTQKNGTVRAQGLRLARQKKKERLEAILRRERDVEAAVAAFHEHRLRAEQVMEVANERAQKVLADGRKRAADDERAASAAIGALAALGETRESIAELTGVSLTAVRQALASCEESQSHEAPPGGGDSSWR